MYTLIIVLFGLDKLYILNDFDIPINPNIQKSPRTLRGRKDPPKRQRQRLKVLSCQMERLSLSRGHMGTWIQSWRLQVGHPWIRKNHPNPWVEQVINQVQRLQKIEKQNQTQPAYKYIDWDLDNLIHTKSWKVINLKKGSSKAAGEWLISYVEEAGTQQGSRVKRKSFLKSNKSIFIFLMFLKLLLEPRSLGDDGTNEFMSQIKVTGPKILPPEQ